MTQTQNSPNKSTAIDLDFNPMRPVRQVDKLTILIGGRASRRGRVQAATK